MVWLKMVGPFLTKKTRSREGIIVERKKGFLRRNEGWTQERRGMKTSPRLQPICGHFPMMSFFNSTIRTLQFVTRSIPRYASM